MSLHSHVITPCLVTTLPRAAEGAMGEGSGEGGSAAAPADAVFAAVGVRAHSDAAASTSGGGEIPEPAEPTAAHLEAETAALHARLRETSEHLASLDALGRSGLAEALGMGGGVEADVESLLDAFAGMESGLEGVTARLRERLAPASGATPSDGDDEGSGVDDIDLDARIAAAEARLAATRRARDEAAAAAAAADAGETLARRN